MPQTKTADNHLYLKLLGDFREKVFHGVYQDGELIPAERDLARELEVSRVTIRKTLEMLERDQFVSRVQGSGTRLTLRTAGYPGTMDILALVAPTQNDFFASFIECFEWNAERNDSLVLFSQARKNWGGGMGDYLFRLLQKNIRDVILWLPGEMIDGDRLRRLRGLGMNLVFFDVTMTTPYADCVSVDNWHAVSSLYWHLISANHHELIYVGWDNCALSSIGEREQAFREMAQGRSLILRIPWLEKDRLENALARLTADLIAAGKLPDGFLCGDGEIGIGLRRVLNRTSCATPVVCVDDLPGAEPLGLTVYAQPLGLLAQQVYQCLWRQNHQSAAWRAANYQVKGDLIIRSNC